MKDILLRAFILCIVVFTIWGIILLTGEIFPKRKAAPDLVQIEQRNYTKIINHQNTVIEKLKHQVDSLNQQLMEINIQKQKLQDGYKNYTNRTKPANLNTLQGYFSKRYSEPAPSHSTKSGK